MPDTNKLNGSYGHHNQKPLVSKLGKANFYEPVSQ
jgi:hypothetical protein